ncbi:MAG: alpha/beta hydrolase [Solimonas sp.]
MKQHEGSRALWGLGAGLALVTVTVLGIALAGGAASGGVLGLRYSVPDGISPAAHAIYARYAPLLAAASLVAKAPHTAKEFAARRADDEAKAVKDMPGQLAALGVTWSEQRLGGVDVLELRPPNWRDDGTVLIHAHGGGWVLGSARSSAPLASQLAITSGRRVISVDYTVAPQAQWQQVTDQIVAVYRAVLASGIAPRGIGLVGESAGGDIVAATTLKLRDQGLQMPGALLLLSPGMDLAMKSDTWTTLREADPVLSDEDSIRAAIALYVPRAADLENPYVSPIYGDFSKGYPPVLMQVGTREIVLSDSVRLYQAVKNAGGSAVLDIYEGMPHVFVGYMKDTPEQKAAFDTGRRFWATYLQAKSS